MIVELAVYLFHVVDADQNVHNGHCSTCTETCPHRQADLHAYDCSHDQFGY